MKHLALRLGAIALLLASAGLAGCAAVVPIAAAVASGGGPVAAIGAAVISGVSLYCDGVTPEGKQLIRDKLTDGKQVVCGHTVAPIAE